MTVGGLLYETVLDPKAADGSPVVVLLHGRGADRHDLLSLGRHLPRGWSLVAPQAPHPGGRWGYGGGWAWYRYLGDDRVEGEGLAESLEALDDFLRELPGVLGFTPGPVVLGGFSQGGSTSISYALTRPGAPSRIAVFSGFLPDVEEVPVDPARASELSVFWGHGTADPAVFYHLGQRGRETLSEAGATVEIWDGKIGHGIAPEEWEAFGRWLSEIRRTD